MNVIGTTTKEAAPHSYVDFDITVNNLGYYKDMFKLEFIEENNLEALVSKQLFVLNPGESQNLKINVFTPEKFFDLGTPNKIEIYAASSGDPDSIHIGTIVVITKGIFISPLVGIILVPIIIFLIIIYILFFYNRNKKQKELFGKPDKPWNLSEEKKYLEKLKEEDKEEYKKVKNMMQDEYKSALLWYENYHNDMIKRSDSNNGIIFNLFKKPKKDDKPVKQDIKIKETENNKNEKEEKQKPKILKTENTHELKEKNSLSMFLNNFKIKQKTKTTEEKQKEKVKTAIKLPIEKKSRKEKALLKIKRSQEKQRKKLGKKSFL
jgi:hypothetical protein